MQVVSKTPKFCPSEYYIIVSGHLNKIPIFFRLYGICYVKKYDDKIINTKVKRDLKLLKLN